MEGRAKKLMECHMKDLIMRFTPSSPDIAYHLPSYLKEDDEVNRLIAQRQSKSFGLLHSKYMNIYDIAKMAVTGYPRNIGYVSEQLQLNSDLVDIALSRDPLTFPLLTDELRTRKDIAMRVLTSNRSASRLYVDLTHEMRHDRDFVLEVASRNGNIVAYAQIFREDDEIMRAAISNWGDALRYAPDRMKKDRALVMSAVKNVGWALQHADRCFWSDLEVVREAIQESTMAWKFVQLPPDCLELRDLLKESIQYDGGATFLKKGNSMICENKLVVELCVKDDGLALQYASTSLRSDETIVKMAMRQNRNAIYYAESAVRMKLNPNKQKEKCMIS